MYGCGKPTQDGGMSPSLVAPSVPCTGNLVTDILVLVEGTLGKQRAQAAQRRDQADSSQDRAEQKQVEQMRKEARETFKQALVSGAISMGAGAAQCVGAGLGAAGAASDCERQAAKYAAEAKALDACASVLNASAKGTEGLYGAEIKSIQADAKEQEHQASRAGRDKQREADLERELSDMQNKSLERLETLLQGEHQTRLALIQAHA
jgi:hypothetical protein